MDELIQVLFFRPVDMALVERALASPALPPSSREHLLGGS
jgi:hypothetical protein